MEVFTSKCMFFKRLDVILWQNYNKIITNLPKNTQKHPKTPQKHLKNTQKHLKTLIFHIKIVQKPHFSYQNRQKTTNIAESRPAFSSISSSEIETTNEIHEKRPSFFAEFSRFPAKIRFFLLSKCALLNEFCAIKRDRGI
jgi:hypothetical protein